MDSPQYRELVQASEELIRLGDIEGALTLMQKADEIRKGQQFTPTADPNYFAGPLRSIAQGATFGFGDEAEAALTGRPLGQIQADMAQFSKSYPAADIAGNVGGGLGAGLAGGGLLNAAKTAIPAVGRAAGAVAANIPRWMQVTGAAGAGGALYGAGAAEPGERAQGAAVGGLVGAGVGAGGMAAGAVLGKAYEIVLKPLWRQVSGTPARDAKRIISEYLTRSGMTPDDALRALQESGDEAMILDLSPHLRDLAYDTRSGIGPGRTIIDDALKNRQIGQQNRLVLSAGQTLGAHADDARDFVTAITKAQSEQAAPLYASAHQQNIRTNPVFEKLWEGVPKSAVTKAREMARREWHAGLIDMPPVQGERVINPGATLPGGRGGLLDDSGGGFDFDALPDVLRVDYVKRAWDDIISTQVRNGEKQSARANIALRNKILDFVDEQVPEFKQARGIWAGGAQLKSAAELGQEVFSQNADDLADIVSRYGESERQAFRYGVAQAIRERIESTGSATADAARKLAGSAKNRRIIRAAFGNDEEFERFMQQIEREGVFTESRYEITGNSKTAERLNRRAERTGDIPEMSRSGLMAWLARHFGPQDPLTNPVTNRIVAQFLTRNGRMPYEAATPPMRPGGLLQLPAPTPGMPQRRGLL